MQPSSRHEWPMDVYLSAWKTFRRLSNENAATAEHLIQQPKWPTTDGIRVVDIGCGDGRLLETILLQNPTEVNSAVLIDPDIELLNEASACVRDKVRDIETLCAGVEETFASKTRNADVVLLVHVVYLLRNGTLKRALEACPPTIPLYIVLDAEDSVFTSLWHRTAPKYHARALAAHRTVQNLASDQFSVAETTIDSTIRDPLARRRTDIRDALLSILTYSDVSADTETSLRHWIEKTLRDRTHDGEVRCRSTCYEIVRHSPAQVRL